MASANQRIGEYLIEAPVGSGAFGEVWRARHHVWEDQVVAIKIPKDPQYLRALQREGIAVQGLVHPNIVRAIGFDPYADPPYLVTEYVPGSNLRALIAQRALKPADAVAVMRQVLAALTAAHARGIVHGDVKPENVLIHASAATAGYGADGVVKLTDFGLGRMQVKNLADSIVHSQSLDGDQSARIAGTLEYMSPEQRAGGEVDPRADLYSCGVMLFEMLTGEKPAGTDVPSDLNAAVPAHLNDAFRRSYSRLDKRFASASEFAAALGAPTGPPPLRQVVASSRQCPGCRTAVSANDQFCMNCGQQLVQRVRRCAKCSAYPDPADRFCLFCGESLTAGLPAGQHA